MSNNTHPYCVFMQQYTKLLWMDLSRLFLLFFKLHSTISEMKLKLFQKYIEKSYGVS